MYRRTYVHAYTHAHVHIDTYTVHTVLVKCIRAQSIGLPRKAWGPGPGGPAPAPTLKGYPHPQRLSFDAIV